jgi:hypothetical protein
MKKMKTLFVVDRKTDLATDKINQECDWINDIGVLATVKFEGTATLFQDNKLYKRWDRKLTKRFAKQKNKLKDNFVFSKDMLKEIPLGAIPCQDDFDPVTFHQPFWVEVDSDNSNVYYNEALERATNLKNGNTYELIGEKVQSNYYDINGHELIEHGSKVSDLVHFDFVSVREWLKNNNEEGLVFRHPDGRMCKIRRKDFFEFKVLFSGRKVDWRDDNIIFD